MEITMSRATVSLAIVLVILCTVDSIGGNYLAFPRMGRSKREAGDNKRKMPWNFIFPRKRGLLPGNFISPRKRGFSFLAGYLAFPRMGRSKVNDVNDCCGIGLKSEFLIGQGKDEVRYVCGSAGAACCEGLREMIAEKPDGVGYSMCIPDAAVKSSSSSQVISKLKNLLQN